MIVFPLIELLDRYAIATVKWRRTNGGNQDELAFYHQQIQVLDLQQIHQELSSLQKIHDEIWDLENELKSGKEQELPLEEIGRRAIQIRDKNNVRINLKNAMAEKLGCAVREIKQDHLSEKR